MLKIKLDLIKEEGLKIMRLLNNTCLITEITILIMIDSHSIHQEETFKEDIMIIMTDTIEEDQ